MKKHSVSSISTKSVSEKSERNGFPFRSAARGLRNGKPFRSGRDRKKTSRIQVGAASIELLTKAGRFLGLGKISIDGVPLRAATAPLRPEIMTPDGIRYDTFRLDAVRKKGNGLVLVTTAFGRQAMFGEYRDEYDSLLAWPTADPMKEKNQSAALRGC